MAGQIPFRFFELSPGPAHIRLILGQPPTPDQLAKLKYAVATWGTEHTSLRLLRYIDVESEQVPGAQDNWVQCLVDFGNDTPTEIFQAMKKLVDSLESFDLVESVWAGSNPEGWPKE